MTKQAKIAIRAAKLRHTCGHYAARRYVINHGGNLAAYRLACQLQAVNKGD